MFDNFDKHLFDSKDFKEDSVREVIIAPILKKMGYHSIGENTVVRSKTLSQPFIYVGTKRHPVNIIPDYTLYHKGVPIMILDAKSPIERVDSAAHIQQAYSYAIHPEIQVSNFALCNGKRLAIYSTTKLKPLLDIGYEEYESRWEEIERYLSPRYLLNPGLRNFKPDFGLSISRMGMSPGAEIIMLQTKLGLFAKVSNELYSASVNADFAGKIHCISFDFTPDKLHLLIAGLPAELRDQFSKALSRSPFQAGADLCIDVDIRTVLGEPIEVESETFVPLVINEVLGSRFNPFPQSGGEDIPPHIFRLSKSFKVSSEKLENS